MIDRKDEPTGETPRIAVVLGSQRSGTTAIGRLAGAQEGVAHVGEIFHAVRGPQDDPDFERYLTVPEANFFSFKERFLTRFPALVYPSNVHQTRIWEAYRHHLFSLGSAKLWVIDVKYNSLHHLNPVWQALYAWPMLFTLLAKEKAPILHVVREDLFAQALSGLRADHFRHWHSQAGGTDAPQGAIGVDPRELERRMNTSLHLKNHYANLLASYAPTARLTYEQAFAGGDLTAEARRAVAALYGLARPLSGAMPLEKVAKGSLSDQVSNAAAVLAHFKGGQHEAGVMKHLG